MKFGSFTMNVSEICGRNNLYSFEIQFIRNYDNICEARCLVMLRIYNSKVLLEIWGAIMIYYPFPSYRKAAAAGKYAIRNTVANGLPTILCNTPASPATTLPNAQSYLQSLIHHSWVVWTCEWRGGGGMGEMRGSEVDGRKYARGFVSIQFIWELW